MNILIIKFERNQFRSKIGSRQDNNSTTLEFKPLTDFGCYGNKEFIDA